MTDGQAAEPPQGSPGGRALGAMENAARRAREASGAAALLPQRGGHDAPTPAYRMPDRMPDGRAVRRMDRWLVVAVAVVAALVVAAGIALALSPGTSSRTSVPPTTATVAVHGRAARPAPSGGRNGRPTPTEAAPPSTSATVPPSPGGPPVISSIDPASGAAGQTIAIGGANFLSSDGRIVATFNGQTAATSCPAQNTCTVTVPPSSGSQSAQVTITTPNGTSNAGTFTYR